MLLSLYYSLLIQIGLITHWMEVGDMATSDCSPAVKERGGLV